MEKGEVTHPICKSHLTGLVWALVYFITNHVMVMTKYNAKRIPVNKSYIILAIHEAWRLWYWLSRLYTAHHTLLTTCWTIHSKHYSQHEAQNISWLRIEIRHMAFSKPVTSVSCYDYESHVLFILDDKHILNYC